MMEGKKPAVPYLLILLLALSCVLSLGGVTEARRLVSRNPLIPELDEADQVIFEELPVIEEEFLHGRMDIESNDYPGSGANNRHDPKPPGRV